MICTARFAANDFSVYFLFFFDLDPVFFLLRQILQDRI